MEAGALTFSRRLEAAVSARGLAGQRIGLLFGGTGLALFVVMGVLGLLMRLSQGELYTLPPTWFYRIMTLHGAGMLVAALLAQMGAMWYAVRGSVSLSVGRALVGYLAVVCGAVLVLVATLGGGFATGWTFLYPLPFIARGGWDVWTTWLFLVGLVVVGAGFMVYCVDLLARVTHRYGTLGRTLGLAFLRGRDDGPPPPQVIGGTVVAIAGLISSAAGVTILAAEIGRLIDSSVEIDALWAKNVTYFFGHTYANLIIYLAVGAVYVLVPRFTGRPWKTTKPIVIGWAATLVFVLTAYFHHLYMDFVQPDGLAAIGTISSSAAAMPVLVVTVYTAMMLVWGSTYRWTLASTLLYLGFAGWTVGGAGAVIDSIIPVNFRLHNTLWVPAHFHTYLLLGVMFWAMALVTHVLEQGAGRTAPRALRVSSLTLMLVGGFGLVFVWYISGALGTPRRYAVQPFGMAGWSLAGGIFALVFASGFLVYLVAVAHLVRAWRARPRAAVAEAPLETEPASAELPVERPVRKARELFLLGVVMTVAPVALLPPVVEAAEDSIRWHHLDHAALFLAGAAAGLAVISVGDVWSRVRRSYSNVGLGLAILAPVVSLLAMTPRFYDGLEDNPGLHLGYHLLFFVGLGALTAIGAARLGRTPAWTMVLLSVGMGVLYAAGVLGG
jgi:cytochrome c oxidase subunit 1